MIVLAKLQLAIAFRYFCKIGMHPEEPRSRLLKLVGFS